MTDEEAYMTIGLLVVEAREARGWNRVMAAERIGVNYRTLQNVERGVRLPFRTTLAGIERGLGWVEGSLTELWNNRKKLEFGSVHEYDLRPKPKDIPVPLAKASELTTEELLAELSFRVLVMSRHEQTTEDPQ